MSTRAALRQTSFAAGPPGEAGRQAVASRIRNERAARGWTLRDLGTRVRASIARLSAIEHGKQSLDIGLLVAIARAFDVGVERLLPHGRGPMFCVARQSAGGHLPMRMVHHESEKLTDYHNKLRPLADAVTGKYLEPFDIEVWPVGDSEMKFISHHHEEFLLVISGGLECHIKAPDRTSREVLAAGDCIHFWSYLPHCLRSTGTSPARSIHVLCSLDEPADSEVADGRTGPVFLVDGVQRGPSEGVAARLQSLRRRRGMRVAEFARQMGISPRRLVAIERGEKTLSVDLLLEVCHRFHKPLEYFLAATLDVQPSYELRRGVGLQISGGASTPAGAETRLWPCRHSAELIPLSGKLPGQRMAPALLSLRCAGGSPQLVRHRGQEFMYVLKGSVRVTTQADGQDTATILSPGDACLLDASIPHAFQHVQVTPYEPGRAEVLAVSWRPAWEQ